MILPGDFDLRNADWFEVCIDSTEAVGASIDFRHSRFAECDDGSWQASVTGHTIYALCKAHFVKYSESGKHSLTVTA
jgi:hypothetical protein